MPLEQPIKTRRDALGRESRREFLRKMAGGLSLGVTAGQQEAEAARRRRPRAQKQQQEATRGEVYNTGRLEGRNLADLFSLYSGIKSRVPPKVVVDFKRQLEIMWDIKRKRSRGNPVVIQTGREIQKLYKEKAATKLNLERYLAWIDKILLTTRHSINWDRLEQIKSLNNQESNLVKTICSSIDSRDLVAYSLTELMPSRDGQLNALVLDFLLKSAGREYVESIPAMYDPKTSFGPYQFTEYALYDVPGEAKRGASIINQALPEQEKIPGSVSLLRGEQHYKAGFLFMIDNIANLTNKRYNVLNSVWRNKKDDLVIFVATAHHMPGPALNAARRWLDNKARLPFHVSCGSHLRRYAIKTRANLDALQK